MSNFNQWLMAIRHPSTLRIGKKVIGESKGFMPNEAPGTSDSQAHKVLDFNSYVIWTLIFFIVLSMGAFNAAMANGSGQNGVDPTALGPYKIGHTTMLVTDPTRFADSTPLSAGSPSTGTGPSTPGRPLFLHVLYPSNGGTGAAVTYTENNPLYDGTHTGYDLVNFTSSVASPLGAREGIPLAPGKFPLVIFSPGSFSPAGVPLASSKELLASNGYIVVTIDHTGDDGCTWVAFNTPVLPGYLSGVNSEIDIPRAQDISFIITTLLSGSMDPQFANAILANQIGLFGFSLGGSSTMMSVAGLQSMNVSAEPRIKSAIAISGTDNGDGFTASDYANVKVPVMLFYTNEIEDINRFAFPMLTNSTPKYYVDVAGSMHHPNSSSASFCDFWGGMLAVANSDPSSPELSILQGFYENRDTFAFCPASFFSGISDTTLSSIPIDPAYVHRMLPLLPLRKNIPLSEIERLNKWYMVSFFNTTLKGDTRYATFLTNSLQNQLKNPLVDFAKNCHNDGPNKPINIKAGDKITFVPSLLGYKVSYSSGNSLLPNGGNDIKSQLKDSQLFIPLQFSFKIPGYGMVNGIDVNRNGAVTTASRAFNGAGSPWEMKGEMTLSGEATIAPLMNQYFPLDASSHIYVDAQAHSAIITWDSVPTYTSAGNQRNTFQVVIYDNGTIEMRYGLLSGVGSDIGSTPNWLGQVGIATGNSIPIVSRLIPLVDFTTFTKPTFVPMLGAILQQYYISAGNASCQ